MLYRTLLPLSFTLLFTGCGNNYIPNLPQPQQVTSIESPTLAKEEVVTPEKLPPVKKKHYAIKKVEDSNFSDHYMYPETPSVKTPKLPTTTSLVDSASDAASPTMTKATCIAMLGEEKFNKYTQMFGSEAASIKRCAMLKAMTK